MHGLESTVTFYSMYLAPAKASDDKAVVSGGLKRPSQAQEEDRLLKIARMASKTTNDWGQQVMADFSFPSRKHGWVRFQKWLT